MKVGSIRCLAALAGFATVVGLLASPASSETTNSDSSQASVESPEAEAERTDQPVEVVDARSETTTLFANPDGTYSQKIASEPVRVLGDDGEWEKVDYTLERSDDGSLVPKSSPYDVQLSGGGSMPLTEQQVISASLTTQWPDDLPEPRLDGNSATYDDVFPGVDLRMTVDAGGVSQVLIVKSREAAQLAELDSLDIGMKVSGDADIKPSRGGFVITDDLGREIATATKPLMWDSSGTVLDEAAQPIPDHAPEAVDERVTGPATGDSIAPVSLALDDEGMTLEPAASALSGHDVDYPVYIDPKVGVTPTRWAMAFKQNPSTSFYKWDDSNGQGVGYQDYNGVSTKRLFWWFPISGLNDADVISAQFEARMVWSASCTETTTELYRVASFGSSLTWNNQPRWSTYQDSVKDAVGWPDCNPNGKDQEWNIGQAAQVAANSNSTYLAFGMRAKDETNNRSWKRFLRTASISITYNRRPSTPNTLRIGDAGKCGDTIGPFIAAPKFSALSSDPDKNNIEVHFHYWRHGNDPDTSVDGSRVDSGKRSYSPSAKDMKSSTGAVRGGTYTLRARAYDSNGLASADYAECDFVVDPYAPPKPEVTLDESEDDLEWAPGVERTFSIAATGTAAQIADVSAYKWSVNSDKPDKTASANGTAKIGSFTLKATAIGVITVRVWALDKAGNLSPPRELTFEANEPILGTLSRYTFDTAGSSAVDVVDSGDTSPAVNLTASNQNVFGLHGRFKDAAGTLRNDRMLTFPESAAYQVNGAKTLSKDRSFIVSAWIDPVLPPENTDDEPDTPSDIAPVTAVSYGTTSGSPFLTVGVNAQRYYELKVLNPATNTYATIVSSIRETNDPGLRQVVATYRAADGQLGLTVIDNQGAPQTVVSRPGTEVRSLSPSMSSGSLRLGGAQGSAPNPWVGKIDDVVVAQGWAGEAARNQLFTEVAGRIYQCEYTGVYAEVCK